MRSQQVEELSQLPSSLIDIVISYDAHIDAHENRIHSDDKTMINFMSIITACTVVGMIVSFTRSE